jgi:hypothetical protein
MSRTRNGQAGFYQTATRARRQPARQQSAHIKELAGQLQGTVSALEKAAALADARLKRVLIFTALAVAFSAAALGVAFVGARVT